MENKTNPEEKFTRTERIVDAVIAFVLVLSGLVAVYSLIWANWPIFKISVTIAVSILFGICFGTFMADHFDKLFKK